MRVGLLLLSITISIFVGALSLWRSNSSPQSTQTQATMTNLRGSLIKPGSQSAKDTFQQLLLSSIPTTVTDLQGEAETWQGYSAYLRFRADAQTVANIIASGYVKVPSLATNTNLRLHSPPQFTPAWNPAGIMNAEFYRADVQNGWTHSGTHYLIYEPATGVVYFIGSGA